MPSRSVPPLGESVRRKVRREGQAIQRALASQHDIHVAVHEARKAIRRLRALLALAKPHLEDLEVADRALARLGDGLSALRDAHVLVITAKTFAARNGERAWSPAIARLVARRDALMGQALARDPGFKRRRAVVERAARQLEDLRWDELKPADVRRELKRSVRRTAKAGKRARAHPEPVHLHRWRRRVRRLRMQLQGLARVAPDLVKEASSTSRGQDAKSLHTLGDRLGDRRDEALLRNVLRRMRDLPGRAELISQLCQDDATPWEPAASKRGRRATPPNEVHGPA